MSVKQEGASKAAPKCEYLTPFPVTPTKNESSHQAKEVGIRSAEKKQTANTSPSTSGSSKRKRNDCVVFTPSKWAAWEDAIVIRSIVAKGEQGIDWHATLDSVNEARDEVEHRTMNAIRTRWIKILRPRLVDMESRNPNTM